MGFVFYFVMILRLTVYASRMEGPNGLSGMVLRTLKMVGCPGITMEMKSVKRYLKSTYGS